MKLKTLSVRRLFRWVAIGLTLSMTAITVLLFLVTKHVAALFAGGGLLLCALIWPVRLRHGRAATSKWFRSRGGGRYFPLCFPQDRKRRMAL